MIKKRSKCVGTKICKCRVVVVVVAGVPRPSYITNIFLDFLISEGINRCSGGFGKVRLVTPEVPSKFQLKRTILDPFREKTDFQKTWSWEAR